MHFIPSLLIGVLCKPTPGLDCLHRFLSFQLPMVATLPASVRGHNHATGASVLAELHPGLFVMLNINMYFMRAPVKTTNGKYPDRHRAEDFGRRETLLERIPELASLVHPGLRCSGVGQ